MVKELEYLMAGLNDIRVGYGGGGSLTPAKSAFLSLVVGPDMELPSTFLRDSCQGWFLFLRGEKAKHIRRCLSSNKHHPHHYLAMLAYGGELSSAELLHHLQEMKLLPAAANTRSSLHSHAVCPIPRPDGYVGSGATGDLAPFDDGTIPRGTTHHVALAYGRVRTDRLKDVEHHASQQIGDALCRRQNKEMVEKAAPWVALWPTEAAAYLRKPQRKVAELLNLFLPGASDEAVSSALHVAMEYPDVLFDGKDRGRLTAWRVQDYLQTPRAEAWCLFFKKLRKRTGLDSLLHSMPESWLQSILGSPEASMQARRALASYTSSNLFVDALRPHARRPTQTEVTEELVQGSYNKWREIADRALVLRQQWSDRVHPLHDLPGSVEMKLVNALLLLRDKGDQQLQSTHGLDTWVDRNYEHHQLRHDFLQALLKDVLDENIRSMWLGLPDVP